MRLVEINKKFTNDEEYFAFEEASELKHELINGNLYETSAHQNIIINLKDLLQTFLKDY
jgi:hypothetical protein